VGVDGTVVDPRDFDIEVVVPPRKPQWAAHKVHFEVAAAVVEVGGDVAEAVVELVGLVHEARRQGVHCAAKPTADA
jgi:hypothetical protein